MGVAARNRGAGDYVELVDGIGGFAGAAEVVFATLRGMFGDNKLADGLIRDGWSNGYLHLGPPLDIAADLETLLRKFDPLQPRDGKGKWSGGPNLPGLPDIDDDSGETVEPGDYDEVNAALPQSYLDRYGKVISESNAFDVDVVVTEKRGFHISRGLEDREVLMDLDPFTARVLADMAWDAYEGVLDMPDLDEATGVKFEEFGGGHRLTWPNGQTSIYGPGQISDLGEALRINVGSYEEEFGVRAAIPSVRAIVADELQSLLRKYDPNQPRDPDGKFSKIGAIKNALAALAGKDASSISDTYGVATFADREGAGGDRHVEWEADDDGNFTFHINTDEYEPLDDENEGRMAVPINSQAFGNLTAQIGLLLLKDEEQPFDPADRQSLLLHSILATSLGAAQHNDDESYIDISSNSNGYFLEAGDGANEAWSMELSKAELAQLHASMLLTQMAQRPWLRSDRAVVAAEVRSLLREFSEGKVKRDRKGRFAKKASATEVLSEMDALMEKLGALMKSSGTDDDEASDLDLAMDYIKSARRSREIRGDEDEDYFNLDTVQYHNLEITGDKSDGTVMIDHDGGGFMFSAADAEEMAAAIDEFDNIAISDGMESYDEVAEKVASSGDVKAVLWGNGVIEIGPIDSFTDDSDNNLIIDPSEADDARNVADALEKVAEHAMKGKTP